ncbi:MAG: hypothetical protein M1835_000452 [Candelina submexicana]|nr:MAG: hypothetical protein M1835_000452 [Candelina submexicana]
MAGAPDGLDLKRRTSLGFFKRPSLSNLTPINTNTTHNGESSSLRKRRPASFFTSSPSFEVDRKFGGKTGSPATPDSPKSRPRTLMKSDRPTSIFGSLRSKHSPGEEEEKLTKSTSKASSIDEDFEARTVIEGRNVSLHGWVQSTGTFRKKKEYLVLTDTHLLRFKSPAKASEAFPSITTSLGRSNTTRHASMASAGSAQDIQTMNSHSSAETHGVIPLNEIIAVYRLEDGKPYFSIEIAYLDNQTNHGSSLTLQINDFGEADLWLGSIRGAATKARLTEPLPFPQKTVDYVVSCLDQERDYDPDHFQMFKIVKRALNKATVRSSSDDLSKLASTISYLVIGINKIHLLPLPKPTFRSSSSSLNETTSRASFGIMALTSLTVKSNDDAMEVVFRLPLAQSKMLQLASTSSAEIALYIRRAADFLRPEWQEQPFAFHGPPALEEDVLPVEESCDENKCFDRTLIAYCAAYNVDTSNIRYTINYATEDAPCFKLLPPANPRRSTYTVLELLALMRALRYNQSFLSISFRGINLDVLHGLCDQHGTDHVPWTTRSGVPLDCPDQGSKSLLVSEIQALALKSKRLRRLDFAFCIARKPQDDDTNLRDPGCEISEAIFPLCRKQLTNVDWIVLSGIELGDEDLGYLVDAGVERMSHLRALEISRCGLTDRSMQLILNAMLSQDNTLESIDISGNLARLSPATFQGQIGHFAYIRKINLSRVHRTSGPEPLIAPETLLTWRLEELNLSETIINEQTVDSISAYLASNKSSTLRNVRLNGCGLTGRHVAVFLRSMTRSPGEARTLHLHVSENRLEEGHDELAAAINDSYGPTHLTMNMLEYKKENNFRELVQALRNNKTLRYLDISKASLPYDANADTCEAFKQMFAENETLEELDISGEYAHLEVAKFGIGLNDALTGLEQNHALKVLRVEYQKLGLRGANTLSAVFQQNSALQEIYCEHNEINLQGLTGLINGLADNTSVLYLPEMHLDRKESLSTVEREIQSIRVESSKSTLPSKNPIRRTFAGASRTGSKALSPLAMPDFTDQDVTAALHMVNEKWDRQVERLRQLLRRNMNLANGIDPESIDDQAMDSDGERPTTATSLVGILEKAKLQSTPTLEKEATLGDHMVHDKFDFELGGDGDEDVSPPLLGEGKALG